MGGKGGVTGTWPPHKGGGQSNGYGGTGAWWGRGAWGEWRVVSGAHAGTGGGGAGCAGPGLLMGTRSAGGCEVVSGARGSGEPTGARVGATGERGRGALVVTGEHKEAGVASGGTREVGGMG